MNSTTFVYITFAVFVIGLFINAIVAIIFFAGVFLGFSLCYTHVREISGKTFDELRQATNEQSNP